MMRKFCLRSLVIIIINHYFLLSLTQNFCFMEFKEILAISGMPGLYRFVAQGAHGVIVESLADGRRTNATGAAKVSALAEIAVFTDQGEVPLSEVFAAMYKQTGGRAAVDPKASPELLKAHFAEIVPEYDRERVHVSDMKKMVAWYNALLGAGMSDFSVREED